MSKRLLFVGVSSMQNHAGQHKLYFLADELSRKGIPVTVLVPDIEENRAFFSDKPLVETRFFPSGSPFADAWQKAKVVDEANWSAIWLIGVGLRSYIVRGMKSRHIPIIKDFDEFPSMIESFGAMRRSYLRWIEHRMIGQAQGFTCASEFIAGLVHKRRPKLGDRLLRLPVAISADEQKIDKSLVERLRVAAKGRPILLYVGSVNKFYEDQLDEVIALARVMKRRNSIALVRVAGTGPDMEYFKAKAVTAGVDSHLEFIGHVRRKGDLAAHMEAAQVLIFPFPATPFNISRCPTKAYHYAAANRPVVTNRTGEVAELFKESAQYYKEGDVEDLADCCQRALDQVETYDNGIPFASLTWEARAGQFSAWLSERGWLPPIAVPQRSA